MRNPLAQEILDRTPPDQTILVSWYADLQVHVNDILTRKGITLESLENKPVKTKDDLIIEMWLTARYKFTITYLSKLQAALGEPILVIPVKVD